MGTFISKFSVVPEFSEVLNLSMGAILGMRLYVAKMPFEHLPVFVDVTLHHRSVVFFIAAQSTFSIDIKGLIDLKPLELSVFVHL